MVLTFTFSQVVLQNSFVRTGSRSIHQRVLGTAAIPPSDRHGASNEQFFERFAKLSRHSAVYGKINRVTDDNEKICEQYQRINDVVVQDLDEGTRNYVQHLFAQIKKQTNVKNQQI